MRQPALVNEEKTDPLRAANGAAKNKAADCVCVGRIRSIRELQKAFAIRMRVFVKEQRVPAEIELDPDDRRAIHLLATLSGKAVGTARVVVRRGNAKIGRMAVLKRYRKKGIGRKLLQRAVKTAIKFGARRVYLHAQVPVISFYEALHFRAVGPVFDEAGIPHRKMILQSRGPRRQPTAKDSHRKQVQQA